MAQKIVDAHMHICQWILPNGENTFDALRQYQKNNNIDFLDIMCCSNNSDLWDGYEMDQCILAAIAKLENPTVFAHGCMYIPKISESEKIPSEFRFTDQLGALMEIGFDGIKFCEFKPDSFKLHNMKKRLEDFLPYFEYCEKYNIPMCWHCADPDRFWDKDKIPQSAIDLGWYYGGDEEYPSYERICEFTFKLLDSFPKLRVMLAHTFFKSYHPDEMVTLFEKYPNVTIDLAPGWEMFTGFRLYRDKWYDIFRRYSNRILFATDATTTDGIDCMDNFAQKVLQFLRTDDIFDVPGKNIAHGIKLEKEYLDNILYKNSLFIVGENPKPINKNALKKYIEKYLPIMPNTKNKEMIEEYYHKNLL